VLSVTAADLCEVSAMFGAGSSFEIKKYFRIAIADQLSYNPTTAYNNYLHFYFLFSLCCNTEVLGPLTQQRSRLILI
jgi:hypothetical protein